MSCGKRKCNVAKRASDLYTSPLFSKSKDYALHYSDSWFILSAKHGLLLPETVVEPYDLSLEDLTKDQRKQWAEKITSDLLKLIKPSQEVVILAGESYKDLLKEKLIAANITVSSPLDHLSIGERLAWLERYNRRFSNLVTDLESLYKSLAMLQKHSGVMYGSSILDTPSGDVPKRGVYFFLDDNESGLYGLPRIVRVGTHAVSENAESTLIGRLRQHIGTKEGIGNHRSSIFRQYVGWSLILKRNLKNKYPYWNVQTNNRNVMEKEKEIEKKVSEYIRGLRIILLEIPDPPSKHSDRSYIEKNSISLLSSVGTKITRASSDWLGLWSGRPHIIKSGLWNIDYVFSMYDRNFPYILGNYVNSMMREGKVNLLNTVSPETPRSGRPVGHSLPFSQQTLSGFDEKDEEDK